MKSIKNPIVLNLFLFIVTLCLHLLLPPSEPAKWNNYADCKDYLAQSKIPLSSLEFYAPHKREGFYPRPFTVPLIYKIAGSEPEHIIIAQKIIHSLTTLFLVFALLQFFQKQRTKIFIIISMYLLMSWWNIFGWTFILLSESLSISLMFCWIASYLLMIKKRSVISVIIHLCLTFLFSFTRDSWPYIFIFFYLLNLFICWFLDKELVRKLTLLLTFSLLIFVVQKQTAKIGNRYRLPIINTIILRILPNDEFLKEFTDAGMPDASRLKKDFSQVSPYDSSINLVFNLYNDTSYASFHHWVTTDGEKTYMKFLISHPRYFLLLDEGLQKSKRVFCFNNCYSGNVVGYSYLAQYLFPIYNTLSVLLLFVLLLFTKQRKNYFLSLIGTLIAVFAINALLSYNADTFEVERHLFITNIVIQFLGILLTALLFDWISISSDEFSENKIDQL